NNPGPGVEHLLNTLTSGAAFTLNVTAGANITSGTARLTFGSATLSGDGTFGVGTGALLTVTGALGGAFNLIKTGAGTMALGGANSFVNTTISAGILQIGIGGSSGTLGSGVVTDNATLALDRSDTITIANLIGAAGAVQQIGGGTTVLSTANSYTGATT